MGSCAGDCPVPWGPTYTCNTISSSLLVTGTCWHPKLMNPLVCSSVSSARSDPFLPDSRHHGVSGIICWVLFRPQHTLSFALRPHCLFYRSPVISHRCSSQPLSLVPWEFLGPSQAPWELGKKETGGALFLPFSLPE